MTSDRMPAVRDNTALSRFELDVAFANYRRVPGTVIITHTETPPRLRGRGIASEVVRGALELIRADGSKVVATKSRRYARLERRNHRNRHSGARGFARARNP